MARIAEDAVRQAYDTARTADAMAAVLGQFDQWTTARTVAADKVAKGQRRLQKAVTPTGNAQRPQSAPTELEAMEAAFKDIGAVAAKLNHMAQFTTAAPGRIGKIQGEILAHAA